MKVSASYQAYILGFYLLLVIRYLGWIHFTEDGQALTTQLSRPNNTAPVDRPQGISLIAALPINRITAIYIKISFVLFNRVTVIFYILITYYLLPTIKPSKRY